MNALRFRITRILPAQIRACVAQLDEEQLWWRPNESSNSVGNLVLHLSGSMRHYIARGLGGSQYQRNRPAEFSERGPLPKQQLVAIFDEAISEVNATLETLDTSRLLDPAKPIGAREAFAFPALPDGSIFQPSNWSPDGSRLAGVAFGPDAKPTGVVLYDLQSGRYLRLTTSGTTPQLLRDGRRLLYEDEGQLFLLDPASGRTKEIMKRDRPRGSINQRIFQITRDNRQLVFIDAEVESDIWLMSPE